MKKVLVFVGIVALLGSFKIGLAADGVLERPQHQDGAWWKVAIDFDQGTMSRNTCFERYDGYLVKMVGEKAKVFGNSTEEIVCPEVANRLLGLGKGILGLHFPLEFNKPKKVETDFHPFATIIITWTGTKTYPLDQRVLEVYELTRYSTDRRNVFDEKLLYSRECGCNVMFKRTLTLKNNTIIQKMFLRDFGS